MTVDLHVMYVVGGLTRVHRVTQLEQGKVCFIPKTSNDWSLFYDHTSLSNLTTIIKEVIHLKSSIGFLTIGILSLLLIVGCGAKQSSSFHQIFKSSEYLRLDTAFQEIFLSQDIGFRIIDLGGGAGSFTYEFDKTINGGKTWTKQGTSLLNDVRGISFISQDKGFLLDNSPAFMPELFVTNDGGSTWTAKPLPNPTIYKDDLRMSNYPVFISATQGIIAIYGWKINGGQNHMLYMLVTYDGGNTWKVATNNHGQELNWTTTKGDLVIHFQKKTISIQDLYGTFWSVSIT